MSESISVNAVLCTDDCQGEKDALRAEIERLRKALSNVEELAANATSYAAYGAIITTCQMENK